MTLNITYRPFVYYRCNVSFGDMLHSTHGIDVGASLHIYAILIYLMIVGHIKTLSLHETVF